jgi:hypothetical protein
MAKRYFLLFILASFLAQPCTFALAYTLNSTGELGASVDPLISNSETVNEIFSIASDLGNVGLAPISFNVSYDLSAYIEDTTSSDDQWANVEVRWSITGPSGGVAQDDKSVNAVFRPGQGLEVLEDSISATDTITMDLQLGLDYQFYAELFALTEDTGRALGSFDFTLIDDEQPSPPAVPEPATMLLIGSGLIGLAAFRRRFRKR